MGYKILITAPTLADRAMAMLDALEATVFTIPDGAPDSLIYDIAAREQIDGIIVRIGEIDATVIDASANLRVLSKNGIGVDNVDVAHATRKGIPVVNGRNSNSQSVAEHALGMMIALLKDFRRLDNSVRNGNWEKATYQGIELQGKHVGLIGFGGNGRALAKLLLPFGVRISAYDPYLEDDAFFEGITRAATLDDFVADIDILSIHCPRTQETENMVDAARFAQMKSSAYLVNCARGGIVDETALVAALQFGDIAAAGIDVFDVEAPPKDHPLWQLSNVLLSPHIAGVTHESFERMGTMAVENAYKILNGEPIDPDCVVNPEALA
jgi:D-3-phosphoglycerate dehydrogenase|tara:strand:+ start:5608 stop:6582 length:975 start_codon:yes stop_codon:yes gene_type:complete